MPGVVGRNPAGNLNRGRRSDPGVQTGAAAHGLRVAWLRHWTLEIA
jgi:hypothetical protein